MGKKTTSSNVKGVLDIENDLITEITKDNEIEYSLSELLAEYDGKHVTITIKEEKELPVKSDEESEEV